MKITDACVYPYPLGDTSVRRFALEAGCLGFDSIVAVGAPPCTYGDVTVLSGLLIEGMAAREIQNQARCQGSSGTVVSVMAGDNGFNRAVAGMRGVHLICGLHRIEKNAFDHVAAQIATDNGTALDIDLAPLVSGRGHVRQRALHRYLDLLVLHRRYEFPLSLSSSAASVLGLRSVRELSGLCSLIGMDEQDMESALGSIAVLMEPYQGPVRVVS